MEQPRRVSAPLVFIGICVLVAEGVLLGLAIYGLWHFAAKYW